MEQIILGQPAKFKLGLINSDTQEAVQATSFSDTTFTFTEPNVVTAAPDTDSLFFNVTPVNVGIINLAVFTTANYFGVSESKSKNFNIEVISAPPPTDLTITRVS